MNALCAALVALAVAATPAGHGGDGARAELRISLKASGLVARNPDDARLFPERDAGSGFWRLRLDGTARPTEAIALLGAWEQRLRIDSAGGAGAGGLALLPAEAGPFWRVRPLDWAIAEGEGLAWRHEVDRAAVRVRGARTTLTVGRQAVGWGRGVVFTAVDLFAPFSPLEVDREWRRGVDAIRAEATLGAGPQVEALLVGADRAEDLAAGARVRARRGDVDGELVGGWRAGDAFGGAVVSAAVGDAEVHGEAAAFRARDPLPAGGVLGSDRVAVKAVAGGSHRFGIWKGITVLGEAHYTSFGARRAEDLARLALAPEFVKRLLRGDTQLAGRYAVAISASSELSEIATATLTALAAPDDGSGVVAPQLRLDLGDKVTVLASLYQPFGRAPVDGVPRSFYGAAAVTGLVQVAVYE